jgi:hypothetical protein
MPTIRPMKSTLLTAAAALLCTGLQLGGMDSQAAAGGAATATAKIVQLPTVRITAQRETAARPVQQLPLVMVVGRRLPAQTARAEPSTQTPDRAARPAG